MSTLAISTPDDQYEREADRVADRVMRMAAGELCAKPAIATLQQACATCENQYQEQTSQGGRQTSRAATRSIAPAAPATVLAVIKSPGHPLEPGTRAFFETRLGRDFSAVRVHSDMAAARSAKAVNARAYTVRQDIVFGADEYAPDTSAGRKLLAHELVHTIQQSAAPNPSTGKLQRTIGDGHDLQAARFAGDPVLEACFDNERLLRFGSSGPAVAKLQQALVDAGFPLPVFGVDGIFKSETRRAVQDYQRAHGLVPDGIVGPITMGSLDTVFAAGGPTPGPPGPGPVPPGPPGPVPAPPEIITSRTVATSPGSRTRTTIGVGEQVDLTHAPGSAVWTTTAGTLSATRGVTVKLTAPDTAQRITVSAGGARISFDVIAPTSVAMDREPGTGVKHTRNRSDSGIQTRVFLGPDTVNFSRARYRERDIAGVPTIPGVYSCNTFSTGHCSGAVGGACPDKALTSTVVAGKGTQSVLGDCAYSGHCGAAPPFVPGSITVSIPYEYKVGAGRFRRFATVRQVHTLAADGSTLTSSKAGANGSTRVAAATVVIPQCP